MSERDRLIAALGVDIVLTLELLGYRFVCPEPRETARREQRQ